MWLDKYIKEKGIATDYPCFASNEEEVCITMHTTDLLLAQFNLSDFNAFDIIVKYLAIENFYGKNTYGMALYKKMAADRVMKSVTSWLERKLFLGVSATKTKVVRPTKSNFLGFTFWKNNSQEGWKCKPSNDRKAKLYDKIKKVLKRKHAVSKPLHTTFTKVNQIVMGWINYFKIGDMKKFIEEFGEWLRHKIRVIIIKQWKIPRRIYANLERLNKMLKYNFTHEDIYKVANSRLGWNRRCGMNVVNYLLSAKVLAIKKEERPGLVNPLEYYLK